MAASLSVSAIVVFSIALSAMASACPGKFSLSMFENGTLIYICRSNNRSSWYETKNACESLKIESSSQEQGIPNLENVQMQWRLPKLDSLKKNQRLFEVIKQSNISSFFFWIGLKRTGDDDGMDWKDPSKWLWSNDNTTLEESFRAETVPWKDDDSKTSDNESTSAFCALAANLNASESIVWYSSKCDGSDMSDDELVLLLICEGIAEEKTISSTESTISTTSETVSESMVTTSMVMTSTSMKTMVTTSTLSESPTTDSIVNTPMVTNMTAITPMVTTSTATESMVTNSTVEISMVTTSTVSKSLSTKVVTATMPSSRHPVGPASESASPPGSEPSTEQWEEWKYLLLGLAIAFAVVGTAAVIALFFIYCPFFRRKLDAQTNDAETGTGGEPSSSYRADGDEARSKPNPAVPKGKKGSSKKRASASKAKTEDGASIRSVKSKKEQPKSDDPLSGKDEPKAGGWSTRRIMVNE